MMCSDLAGNSSKWIKFADLCNRISDVNSLFSELTRTESEDYCLAAFWKFCDAYKFSIDQESYLNQMISLLS